MNRYFASATIPPSDRGEDRRAILQVGDGSIIVVAESRAVRALEIGGHVFDAGDARIVSLRSKRHGRSFSVSAEWEEAAALEERHPATATFG